MNNNELILEGDIYSGDTIDVITGDPEVLVEGDISSSDELSGDATVGVFQGKPGKDGISPTVSVEEIEGGNRVNITDKDGTKSFDVMNGVGGEGGGVTSWNDLIDKPFEEILPAFDITWDGDMAGRGTFSFEENIYFVKVSDEVYTKEQLLNSTMYYSDGRYDTPIEEDIFVSNDGGFIAIGEVLVVFSAETFIGAMGLPEGSVSNGVWFFNWTGEEPCYVKRFIASSTIKKLDSKYLDLEGYAKTEDLEGYTKTEDLEGYAKTEDLSAVAKSGSWNDLEDKPFGVGETSWDLVASGQAASIDKSISLFAKVVEGKNYKLELIQPVSNLVLASNIAPCVATVMNWYQIGNNQDAVWCSAFGATLQVNWNVSSSYGHTVNVYEEVEAISTLDEKYLPKSVVLESELDAKGYQTEEQVTELINNALGVIENGTY